MRFSPLMKAWAWFLLFALLFSFQVISRIWNDSPTDNEPVDITDGYFIWKGDVISNGTHPIFLKMLQTLPLRWMAINDSENWDMGLNHFQLRDSFAALSLPGFSNPSGQERFKIFLNYNMDRCHDRGYQFFEQNQNQFENILRRCRLVTFLFGLGIGLLLFFQTYQRDPAVYLSAFTLWAFEPTLSAFSTQCGSDVPAAFFFFAAILAFQKKLKTQNLTWSLIAGGLLAAAVCSKISMLLLIPIFLISETASYFLPPPQERLPFFSVVKSWFCGIGVFIGFVSLVYLPGTLWENHHWMPLIYFWLNLASVLNIFSLHHPTYFLGQASRLNHWFYFPLAFILKNTIPFVLLSLGVLVECLRKKSYPLWLWLPPLAFFIGILPVQNVGVRYLLPIYPFLMLMAAFLLEKLWIWKPSERSLTGKYLVLGLLFWHAVSVLASYPNMISYYNDLIPWEKKIYYLGDSNIDMGQDIKRLADTAKTRGWKNIKLAQFGGSVLPSFYGMNWNDWTQKDCLGPQPGTVYAVNVLLFQLGPIFVPGLLPIAKSWVLTTPPTGRVGDTWVYYEIPGEPLEDKSPLLESVKIF